MTKTTLRTAIVFVMGAILTPLPAPAQRVFNIDLTFGTAIPITTTWDIQGDFFATKEVFLGINTQAGLKVALSLYRSSEKLNLMAGLSLGYGKITYVTSCIPLGCRNYDLEDPVTTIRILPSMQLEYSPNGLPLYFYIDLGLGVNVSIHRNTSSEDRELMVEPELLFRPSVGVAVTFAKRFSIAVEPLAIAVTNPFSREWGEEVGGQVYYDLRVLAGLVF